MSTCNAIASTAAVREARGREGIQGSESDEPGWQAVFSRVAPHYQIGFSGILSRTAILIARPCLTFVWQFINFF